MTNLNPILERFGNRGYRLAQLDASITAGKIYLAAYAQRLGASGLTFYDDQVSGFFSPHAEGKSVMFLVALGKRARRRLVTLEDQSAEATAQLVKGTRHLNSNPPKEGVGLAS